jgi:hypothetical protein
MKNYVGVEVTAPSLLTWALDGVEGSFSRPGHFNSGEIVLATHWIGDWVGPRARLDAVGKENLVLPGIEPLPSSP